MINFSSLYKKYWQIGFQTRLYDALCPEAYYDSLRRVANALDPEEGGWVLDAGCGSGILLPLLTDKLKRGGRYLGMDILPAGLGALTGRARGLQLQDVISSVQADLKRTMPLKDNSISCAAAHFSVYTLAEKADRQRVFRELWRVLKPGGRLAAANPTESYHAGNIIRASLESLKNQGRPWMFKKLFVYPLTLRLGLKYIERQLQSGVWHGYRPDELADEVEQAGFSVEQSETLYGGSGCLVVARKP